MSWKLIIIVVSVVFLAASVSDGKSFETDTMETSAGKLAIAFIGHGTLMFDFSGMIIHVDPWSKLADYSSLPKADLILITHHHQDHLDKETIEVLRKDTTSVVLAKAAAGQIEGGLVMQNGDATTVKGLKIEAVPAYNLVHMRSEGAPFHVKGEGNGYILTFGDRRVYIAGDTENTPEVKSLTGIDVAFLPVNLPYTMTPEMAADAARSIKPKILYPYHFGDTDTSQLTELLKGTEIEVRIRDMK